MLNTVVETIPGLKWLPWIGEKYFKSKAKLLVIGESHYLWEGEDEAEDILNDVNYTKAIIYNNHQQNLDGVNHVVKHLDGLERMLLCKQDITIQEKVLLSNSFAYHVIVQRGLLSLKERPCRSDYENGWKIAINLISKICPKNIIFIGVEAVKYINHELIYPYAIDNWRLHEKIGNTYPRTFNLYYHDRIINCIAIKHTSSYFSWNKWSKFIENYFDIVKFKEDLSSDA